MKGPGNDTLNYFALPGLGESANNPFRNLIVKQVALKFGMEVRFVIKQDRRAEFVFPRQLIMYVMFKQGYSKRRIGKILSRDRTTVMHGIDAIQNYLDTGHEKAAVILETLRSIVKQ